MQPAFPFVDISTPVELLSTMITPQNPAVLVRDFKTDKNFIITQVGCHSRTLLMPVDAPTAFSTESTKATKGTKKRP